MMSYRDIASKNVFGFIPIERKQVLEKAKEVEEEKKLQKKLEINQNNTSNTMQESHQDMKSSHQKFSIEKNDNLIKEKLVLNDVLDFIKNL